MKDFPLQLLLSFSAWNNNANASGVLLIVKYVLGCPLTICCTTTFWSHLSLALLPPPACCSRSSSPHRRRLLFVSEEGGRWRGVGFPGCPFTHTSHCAGLIKPSPVPNPALQQLGPPTPRTPLLRMPAPGCCCYCCSRPAPTAEPSRNLISCLSRLLFWCCPCVYVFVHACV